jgi:hypothetical protein
LDARSGDHSQWPRLVEAWRLGASPIGELTQFFLRRSLLLALSQRPLHIPNTDSFGQNGSWHFYLALFTTERPFFR